MGKVWMTGGGGADLDPTTAVPADVVYPKVYINKDGDPTTGTMTDRASVNEAISSGVVIGSQAYIRIPNGAYRTNTSIGYPEITLTGQRYTDLLQQLTSDATSPANRIMSGYNAYVNGVKVAGTLTISSVVSFSLAQYATTQIIASWARPAVGPWSGLRVMCKQGGYPTSVNDGTLFYEGSGTSAIVTLSTGLWYFRAWNYITSSVGREYGGYVGGTITNNTVTGIQTFTSSGVFTVPAAVRTLKVFLVGGGAASGGGAGGGGGEAAYYSSIAVTPGQQVAVGIGAGGTNYGAGGQSSFGSYIARGGSGWTWGGGNVGAGYTSQSEGSGGGGGSDGGGGFDNQSHGYIANGQGHTTRAFYETGGTLYSGGGGGSVGHRSSKRYGGAGGAGGGGNGNGDTPYSSNGTHSAGATNTGGGAGGAGLYEYNDDGDTRLQPSRNGGSGICIIRWGY